MDSSVHAIRRSRMRISRGVVLAALLIGASCVLAAGNQLAYAATPPDSCFAFNAGTGTITDYYDHEGNNPANPACPRDVDIPSTIGGITVTNIGTYAFGDKGLTAATLPNSVTTISSQAFRNNLLTSITIPGSVTNIGIRAFDSNQIISLTIPSGVTTISSLAFANNLLTSITIPDSVTSMGEATFNNNRLPDNQAFIYARNPDGSENMSTLVSYGGEKREAVIVPDSVTSIHHRAFQYTSLQSVILPENLTYIGIDAFSYNNLTTLTIPDSVTSIDNRAFYSNSLESVTLSEGLTSIGILAFYTNKLTSITVPNSVTTIGDRAFRSNLLSSITIENSSVSSHIDAFSDNPVETMTVDGTTYTAASTPTPEACFVFNAGTITDYRFADISTIVSEGIACLGGDLVIPDEIGGVSVVGIGSNAFRENNLLSVEIPDSITSIGTYAFRENQLTDITIPASVTSLGSYAFQNNYITDPVVENTATTGNSTVFDVNPIESITVAGTTYTADESSSHEACFVFNSGTGTISDYNFASLNTIISDDIACLGGDLVIPDEINGVPVTTIGYAALTSNQLTSVVLGNAVSLIDGFSFASNKITSVRVPSSLTTIGDYAFAGQTKDAVFWAEFDWSERPRSVIRANAVLETLFYTRIYTEDPSNPAGLTDEVYFSGSELVVGGETDWNDPAIIGGHIINPASLKLSYVSKDSQQLQYPLTFTGKENGRVLQDYLISNGPNIALPVEIWYPTQQELQVARDALASYYRIGQSVEFTPPNITGYITPPAQTFVLGEADNTFEYVYTAAGEGRGVVESPDDELAETGANINTLVLVSSLLIGGSIALAVRSKL